MIIKKILTRASVIFTLCMVAMCAYASLPGGDLFVMLPSAILSLFAYAVLIAALSVIPRGKAPGIRAVFHFAVSAAGFYAIFVLAWGHASDGAAVIARMIFFCAVYALSAAVYYSVILTRRSRRGGDEYVEQFANLREGGGRDGRRDGRGDNKPRGKGGKQ